MTFEVKGAPRAGGVLIVADHASAAVPAGIMLGVGDDCMASHIASDIGVSATAVLLVERFGHAAFCARWSRLVADLNRQADDSAAVPLASDGVDIPGNRLTPQERDLRIATWHAPYHSGLAALLAAHRPQLILSLHSFTPALATGSALRPWQVGVLYNRASAPSLAAIAWLRARGLCVGDQQPYSGRTLNATMNRHAEANAIPYVGIEVRQDEIALPTGQDRYADLLGGLAQHIVAGLASGAII